MVSAMIIAIWMFLPDKLDATCPDLGAAVGRESLPLYYMQATRRLVYHIIF